MTCLSLATLRRPCLVLGAGLVGACTTGSPVGDSGLTGFGNTSTTPTTGVPMTTTFTDTTSVGDSEGGSGDTISLDSTTGSSAGCGNGVIDAGEICDGDELGGEECTTQGFDEGKLGCADDCSDYDFTDCVTYECGNDVLEGDELCDGSDFGGEDCMTQGFDSGMLACEPDCASFSTAGCGTCGNAMIDGTEACDGVDLGGEDCMTQGFDSGTLACAGDCTLDTSSCGQCGNDTIDGPELCDGVDLGGQDCASLGFGGGTLACDPGCLDFDTSGCDFGGTLFGSDGFYEGFFDMPVSLPCDDISATGTATGLSDDSHQVVPIGFTMPIYGTDYTNVAIGSNGTIYFGLDAYLGLANVCMPGTPGYTPTDDIVAVYWDDLNPGAAGEVYYQTLGAVGDRRFVVQWDVPHFGGDTVDLMRFQVMLNESTDTIQICYVDTINAGDTGNSGAEATSGIQASPAMGIQYSCNTPDLTNGLMLMYVPI